MKSSIDNLVTCDLGGTKLLVRICQKGNCTEKRFATGINFKPSELSKILAEIEEEFNLNERSLDSKKYPLAIAFPGLLEGKSCYVSNVLPQFNGFDLTSLTARGNLELVLNDVEAGTYGIIKNNHQVEILIMSGTGIGMGISIDGKVFRGENGYSGELGSCRSYRNGKYTRLAKLASGSALQNNLSLDQNGSGRDLGMAVSWVINCFNPGRIVFAGGMFNESDYRNACFEAIENMALKQSFERCEIEVEAEMHSIVVRGLEVALQQRSPSTF